MSQPGFHWFRAAVATLGAAALLTSCEDSTNAIAVQLNLDRPADIAFACYGGLRLLAEGTPGTTADNVATSAQPLASCDLRAAPRLDTDAIPLETLGQQDLTATGGAAVPDVFYYGFILQSGPGTVAVARFPATRASKYTVGEVEMLDTDPLTPGKTAISIGSQPMDIAVDATGCFAVTANAGTCDMSSLDINSALQFDGQAKVSRMSVTNSASTPITARPAAMLLASDQGRVGAACPANPSGIAYVAYPSCHVVAAIDLATGKALSHIAFAADGTATIGAGDFTCAAECAANPLPTAGAQPVTIDYVRDPRVDTRRLVIGARDSNQLTVVELGATSLPTAIDQVPLFEEMTGLVGVLDVALSPQIGMGNGGKLLNAIDDSVGPQYQFAYAVATDGTVRVADVLNAKRECDTQIDPRVLRSPATTADELNCIEVGTKPRRVGARGPGIPTPVDGVPMSVAILRSDLPPLALDVARPAVSAALLNGYFGVVTSTNGRTYLIDIDDEDRLDLENTAEPLRALSVDIATTLPHQLRDAISNRGAIAETTNDAGVTVPVCNVAGPGAESSGGARIIGTFNLLNLPAVITNLKSGALPFIRQALCSGSDVAELPVPENAFAAPIADRKASFPDTQRVASIEDWRLLWEGSMDVALRLAPMAVAGDGNIHITDRSKPYCAAGIEDYDIVQLRGCDPLATTSQCAVGLRCVLHPESALGVGTCLPEKRVEALTATCRDFMVSSRRYTVAPAPKSNELTLLPRIRELRSTPLSGCTSDTQCKTLADYELQQASELEPKDAGGVVSTRTYQCRQDTQRKGALNRCMMTCQQDSDCDSASACNEGTGLCMEGATPPAECIAGINQLYDLRVSEAFVLLGSVSGYSHPVTRNAATEVCEKPATPSLLSGRLPLAAPPCTDLPDSPNPCSTAVTHSRTEANITPGTCVVGAPETKVVTRSNVPAIRFRNQGMQFHFVDPTYPGDSQCRGDRLGHQGTPLVDVPTAYVGLAYTFRILAGYTPLRLGITAVVPVRAVRGPQQSIWIVDEGDFLSDSINAASTRGKVFRIESKSLNTINVMQ